MGMDAKTIAPLAVFAPVLLPFAPLLAGPVIQGVAAKEQGDAPSGDSLSGELHLSSGD